MGTVATINQSARIGEKLHRELGTLIIELMQDDRTEDIFRNPDGKLWVFRQGSGFVHVGEMSDEQAYSAVATVASCHHAVINHDRPVLETELPMNFFDAARFEAIVPPVVRGPVFAIRMRPRRIFTLDDYEACGILTTKNDPTNALRTNRASFAELVQGLTHTQIIKRAVRDHMNILVVGPTGAGKTSLANAIVHEVAIATPNDRIITIEDTIELKCAAKNHVDLKATGSVSLDDCVRACLRLRPTRIIVGEVRGGEALKLLKSWLTGHPGGVVTIHGLEAASGVIQFESLVAEATSAPKQTLIAETIQLVVFIDQDPAITAGRKVRELAVVTGYRDGRYVLASV